MLLVDHGLFQLRDVPRAGYTWTLDPYTNSPGLQVARLPVSLLVTESNHADYSWSVKISEGLEKICSAVS